MKKKFPKLLIGLLFFLSISSYAQEDRLIPIIKSFLQENHTEFSKSDIKNIEISNYHFSESTEAYHVYVVQKVNQNPIFNAIGNFTIKNNKVIAANNRFEKNILHKTSSSTPSIDALTAIKKAAEQLGVATNHLEYIESEGNTFVISKGDFASRDVKAKLVFFPENEEKITLSWNINLFTKNDEHWWDINVNATTGEIIYLNDWMLSCDFNGKEHKHTAFEKVNHQITNEDKNAFGFKDISTVVDNSSYRVFPLPLESPNDGARQLISNPADISASPHGWHDTNDVAGADYNDTRGNNVFAWENRDGNGSFGTFPSGGQTLTFDFALDLAQDPIGYIDASVTNLFYWNNVMHDIMFNYGFNEVSGNFQYKNYSGKGQGLDFVFARGQDGANSGNGNNASFGTPPDGSNPTMRMFTFQAMGEPIYLTIDNSSSVGGSYSGTTANFGPALNSTGVSAELVIALDDNSGTSTDIYDACDVITNGTALNGKIVIIKRGNCNFTDKIYKAEQKGAVGVIIVNNVAGDPIQMGGTPTNPINIPSIMLTNTNGDPIISALENGEIITAQLASMGPFVKDSSLDATVISHEYGHGISNRLVAGANNTSCLNSCAQYDSNGNCIQRTEQMGEGWSDFFALILTMKPSDLGTDGKAIGTYCLGQNLNGSGFRPAPYSTDFSINGFTYGDTNNASLSAPHGVGFVWATILWDLTWKYIDKYGYDPDIYNGNGGNNMALQLVIDGLKMTSCDPGFIDGRDALLAADMTSTGGANQCLIWQAFADRGVGYLATQGSSLDRFDQVENFDMPPASVLNCSVGTSSTIQEELFQVYPNPAKGFVQIKTNQVLGSSSVAIFDMNGRQVVNTTLQPTIVNTIDISKLNTGVYVIKIANENGNQTTKLMVE